MRRSYVGDVVATQRSLSNIMLRACHEIRMCYAQLTAYCAAIDQPGRCGRTAAFVLHRLVVGALRRQCEL